MMARDSTREGTKFRIYWASRPAPDSADIRAAGLSQLIPVDFTTEEDAIHAAALLLRAREFVWLIERPHGEPPMESAEINARCEPLLRVFGKN